MWLRRFGGVLVVGSLSSLALLVGIGTATAVAGSSPALIVFSDNASGAYEVQPGAPQTAHLVAAAGEFPTFSPNGMQLAYEVAHGHGASDPNETNTIVVASRTGAVAHTILTGSLQWNGHADAVYYPLAWSPNGKELAYGCDGTKNVSASGEYAQICEIDVDTGAHHMITDPATNHNPLVEAGYLTQRMSFTPDGKQIIADVLAPAPCPSFYAATDKCGFPEVGVVDVATGSIRLLTNNYAQAPALSPDGKQIMFYHPKVGNEPVALAGLYVMDVGGSRQRELLSVLHVPAEPGATFSPNGKDILYTAYSNQDAYHLQAFELPLSNLLGTPTMYTRGNYNVDGPDWTAILTTCTVPNLKHKTLAEAKRLLKQAACSLGKVSGPKSHRSTRHVVKQSPTARLNQPAGARVDVRLQ